MVISCGITNMYPTESSRSRLTDASLNLRQPSRFTTAFDTEIRRNRYYTYTYMYYMYYRSGTVFLKPLDTRIANSEPEAEFTCGYLNETNHNVSDGSIQPIMVHDKKLAKCEALLRSLAIVLNANCKTAESALRPCDTRDTRDNTRLPTLNRESHSRRAPFLAKLITLVSMIHKYTINQAA